MKKILLIQTAFLGDVILMTPVISELKRLIPSAEIDVLVKKGNESLLLHNPDIRTVYIFNKSQGKWKSVFHFIKTFRREAYDLTLNLHRFGSSGLIAGFSGATLRYGFRKNPFSFLYTKKFEHTIGDGTHEVERNLSLIQEFGAERRVRPCLFPAPSDIEKVASLKDRPYYCLAPASVWYTKQLPLPKWIALIASLGTEHRIYLLGAPADHTYCEEIRLSATSDTVVNLAGELSLLQSAALMKDAVRNYVNDSGPLHIASAMNAPVTVFFCSTIPDFGFGPLSEEAEIKEVKHLNCRPCGLHGHNACPEGHFNCSKIEL